MIQYLKETLGLRYVPKFEVNTAVPTELTSEWQAPVSNSKLIFVFSDSQDLNWSASHETVFQNMVKALGLQPDQIHKMNLLEISLVDYFSRLRQWNCILPTVFLSQAPDLSSAVKSLGSHNWVEIYSFTEMMKKPELKKISWKTLQALQVEVLEK